MYIYYRRNPAEVGLRFERFQWRMADDQLMAPMAKNTSITARVLFECSIRVNVSGY
jgi:hypothetical protein